MPIAFSVIDKFTCTQSLSWYITTYYKPGSIPMSTMTVDLGHMCSLRYLSNLFNYFLEYFLFHRYLHGAFILKFGLRVENLSI
jgi:hypothetical protein